MKQPQHQVTSGNAELDAKIREWLAWDRNGKTAGEVRRLVKQEKFEQLHKMLMTRLKFESGGLRGKLGAGYNAINDLVVLQTSQGILKYLEETNFPILKLNGVVIGYDGRHGSKRFAELTAAIFIHKTYQVKLFNNVVPTPFVPFAVAKYGCACGIMFTASHSRKEYNGFKVYSSNGTPINHPVDNQIETCILDHLEPSESSWETTVIIKSDKRINPLPEILKSYLEMIKGDIAQEHKDINAKSNLKFTYSPLHGVGYVYFSRAMEIASLKIIAVERQKQVDPNFPTITSPNPEDRSVMELGMSVADENKSNILIVHDPDADSLGVAERPPGENWKIFNGNELGALLGWWALHSYQASADYDPTTEFYMISSAVTSRILRTMSKIEGFKFVETLAGFKWIANKAYELIEHNKKKVVYAFEESMGYMWNTQVLDKDGIQAGVHLATLAAYLYHHCLTLTAHLEEIYHEYGYHITHNSYFLSEDLAVFQDIFHRLRNYEGDNTYPKSIGGKYDIRHIRDLTIGYDTSQPGNRAVLPYFASQQMITFEFANGLIASLRYSRSEQKLKYYMELHAKPKQGSREEIERNLKEMAHWFVEDFCQPVANCLMIPE